MNRTISNKRAQYGNQQALTSLGSPNDLFGVPSIHKQEGWGFTQQPPKASLFPVVPSKGGDSPFIRNDCLKVLGDAKDTVAPYFPDACFADSRRRTTDGLRAADSCWVIQIMDADCSPGTTLFFKFFPQGNQAYMMLQAEEILESVQTLVCLDVTTRAHHSLFFDVHRLVDDQTAERMDQDQVLDFLRGVLGGIEKDAIDTEPCTSDNGLCEEVQATNRSVSANATSGAREKTRWSRLRRLVRRRKKLAHGSKR